MVGVSSGDVDEAIVAAVDVGLAEQARYRVAPDRLVLALGADNLGEPDTGQRVAELRRRGFAAVAGPRSRGHAVAWAARNSPVPFGADACVCFPWSIFGRDGFTLVVEIDPGAGFGAGGHPTTLLLLERLATMDLAGRRVLDVGCGTGVLAIAAALLGATSVTALDIEPAAVAAAERNVAANGVADRVDVIHGELDPGIGSGFDVVVANIVLGVLVAIAPELAQATCASGQLAVSGLSPAQPSTLTAQLAPMVPIWTDKSTDWVAIGFAHV